MYSGTGIDGEFVPFSHSFQLLSSLSGTDWYRDVRGGPDSRLTNNSSLNGSVYIPELRVVPPSYLIRGKMGFQK